MRLEPFWTPLIEIDGYGHATPSGGWSSSLPAFSLWNDMKEGKRTPEGAANIIHQALSKVLFSDEERAMRSSPPDTTYRFSSGDPEVPRAMIRRILNPLYAKLEIFDLELLPIGELEMAMSYLDGFSQQGAMTRYGYISYALHLAQSMEKFGKYLWKLENWAESKTVGLQPTAIQSDARTYLGIAIALSGLAIISHGGPQVVAGITGLFFAMASAALFLHRRVPTAITNRILSLQVGYLSIFLGLVSVTIASFTHNQVALGIFFYVFAYCFLASSILLALRKAPRDQKPANSVMT